MIEYIYFVKCPNCEDEHFDFFDEAKDFALGCLSQKPIITQTEINRNDFGECTDHCDLGTIWSWEDAMGKETAAEPSVSVFTKDDLKRMADGNDPEFDELDNSLDMDFDEPEISEVSSLDNIPDNFRNPLQESNFGMYFKNKEEWEEFRKLAAEIGVNTMQDVKDFMRHTGATPDGLLDMIRAYRDDLGPDFKITEHINDRPEPVESTQELDGIDNAVVDCEVAKVITHSEDEKPVACKGKPIPEGMTIEQLVEEMEENEDTVECTWCNDLFDKSECRKEVDLGWLCSRCEMAIKSRGETLTFREGSYWDFLDEDVATERDLSDLVRDSINHLTNDLGKDPCAEDFADDVIADLENNYNLEIPTDMAKYNNWCSAVACEVSRQFNNTTLEEAWDDMVELEYEDLTFDIGDGEELTTNYTYKTFKDDVELYIAEDLLTEEDVKDLPNGSELLKEGGPELDAFVSEHFDELFNKYYDTILEHYREDAEVHAYENFDYYEYLNDLDWEEANRQFEAERERRIFGD